MVAEVAVVTILVFVAGWAITYLIILAILLIAGWKELKQLNK